MPSTKFTILQECSWTGYHTLEVECDYGFDEYDRGVGPDSISEHVEVIEESVQVYSSLTGQHLLNDFILSNGKWEDLMERALKECVQHNLDHSED